MIVLFDVMRSWNRSAFLLLVLCIHLDAGALSDAAWDQALKFEQELASRYTTEAPEGLPSWRVLRGRSSVLVTVGHSTAHLREGTLKTQDAGTGALGWLLHELADATVLYLNYQALSDPNYYDDNSFKEQLAKLLEELQPRVVLDLHGSHPQRPYDVDFGTMYGASLLARRQLLSVLKLKLAEAGLCEFSDNFFPAALQQTVTKWAAKKGTPAIQLEINSTLLPCHPDTADCNLARPLVDGLVNYIDVLDSEEIVTDLIEAAEVL